MNAPVLPHYMLRPLLVALAFTVAASASAQPVDGRLEAGDDSLNSGEFKDDWTVAVEAGQEVAVVLTSEAFDTYVILISASGEQAEDDDCTDGETTRSCVSLVADVGGVVRVLVTSFAVGETGAYRLAVTVDGEIAAVRGAERGEVEAESDQL